MVRLEFPTTNNEVEYETLVAGLDLAKAARAKNVIIYCDSQVMTNQINGDYECKGERMKKYLDQARRRVNELKAEVIQIPRGENEQADHLAKAASAEHMATLGNELDSKSDWTAPLVPYLKNGVLPDGKEAARKLKVQATRFGIPRVLVSDNGKQFDNDSFWDFCSQLGIWNHYSSLAHPQANGQVEVTNRSLLKIIKIRLDGAKGIWAEELPSILSAYRTTARTPTGETPF
ncbi:uncharacterized protein LOC112000902 [Quercus suber]|uniref:uncharacterized protein LOC112000902 n=1 Tax=Quercus suber TaxID=58331 RepID=UPI000CE196C2|nr:uncharacterized protein LOC112000902 [Quercus suber]